MRFDDAKMRFSLANLMLMMLPLGIALTAIGSLRNAAWLANGRAALAILVLVFALPAMVGAIHGGAKGMASSVLEVVVAFIKIMLILVLIAFVLGFLVSWLAS